LKQHTTRNENGTLTNGVLHLIAIAIAITIRPLKATHKRLTEPTTQEQYKLISDKKPAQKHEANQHKNIRQ